MIRIVADDKIPFLKGALEDVAELVYLPGASIGRADLLEADALITRTRTKCNRALLEGTKIRFIASATIGHDHIDKAYCKQAGIIWTNAPACNSSSVEQYIVSTLLFLAVNQGLELGQSCLGLVGVGNVGKRVARVAQLLGMKLLLNDPPRARTEGGEGFVDLDRICAEADVISFHVPLNMEGPDRSFHLADRAFFERCKPGCVLINSSRGPVVDGRALLSAIQSGQVGSAVLDVFEHEPQIEAGLLEALCLATPHIAGYSLDGKAKGTSMSVQAVSRFFGLGLDKWVPENVPEPPAALLLGDAGREEGVRLLWSLYRRCYDVSADDQRLRENPGSFEHLRGAYPFRREAPAYRVKLFGDDGSQAELLRALGFKVLSDYCM